MSIDKKSTYYDAGNIETIDIIKAKLTEAQFQGYLLGNALKYSCRMNWKDSSKRDAEKLSIYAAQLIEFIQEQKQLGEDVYKKDSSTKTESIKEIASRTEIQQHILTCRYTFKINTAFGVIYCATEALRIFDNFQTEISKCADISIFTHSLNDAIKKS